MNIYCLLSLVVGVLITLIIEWFIKKKDQIQKKVVNHIYFVIALIVFPLFGVLVGALINSKGEELGSWADWASAIGTVGAFIWGFIAINKQTIIQRAMNIEDKRPRFSFEKTSIIQKGEIILSIKEKQSVRAIEAGLKENKDNRLFRISNVSENPIYSMKIILKYNNGGENKYIFHGLPKEQSVVLIPTNFIRSWQEIFIRFRSSASEVGYMQCKKEKNSTRKNTHYYFVKDRNTAVSTYGDDELILPDDEIVQAFDEMFDDKEDKIKPSGIKFIAPRKIH